MPLIIKGSKAKEMVVLHKHIGAVGQSSVFEIKYIDNNQYDAEATIDNDDLNHYNDEGRDAFGDKSNGYIDNDDDCGSYPYNIWSYSEYYGLPSIMETLNAVAIRLISSVLISLMVSKHLVKQNQRVKCCPVVWLTISCPRLTV